MLNYRISLNNICNSIVLLPKRLENRVCSLNGDQRQQTSGTVLKYVGQ